MLDLYILKFSPCPLFCISAGRKWPFTFGSWEVAFIFTSTLPPFSFTYECSLRTRMSGFFWLLYTHQAAKWGFYDEARPIQPQYHWIENSPLNFCLQGPNFISSQLYILHSTIYKSTAKPILNPWLSLELLNPIILPLAVSYCILHSALGPLFLKMLYKYETHILMWMQNHT